MYATRYTVWTREGSSMYRRKGHKGQGVGVMSGDLWGHSLGNFPLPNICTDRNLSLRKYIQRNIFYAVITVWSHFAQKVPSTTGY